MLVRAFTERKVSRLDKVLRGPTGRENVTLLLTQDCASPHPWAIFNPSLPGGKHSLTCTRGERNPPQRERAFMRVAFSNKS